MIFQLQSLFPDPNSQFLSRRQLPSKVGSKLYLWLQAGSQLEKIVFNLFFVTLFSNENVMISWDLKFEISNDKNMRRPMITSICCFFIYAMWDPNKKKRAIAAKIAATITMVKLNIILLQTYNSNSFQMNSNLQQKIKKYQQSKMIKKKFNDTVEERKKKLKQLTSQNQDVAIISNELTQENSNQRLKTNHAKKGADSFMDFKHRRYIETTKQLMQAKSKLTETSHQCEDLKTQVFFQQKKLNQIRQYLKRQQDQQEQILTKKANKLQQQKNQKIKMYEDRVSKNVEHVEQLLKQKEEQNERKLKFIQKKKKFEEIKRKTKQKYEDQLKIQKQKWIEEERFKRQSWQKLKSQQIQSRTLRNLQPQIQRIVQRSKDQIDKIRSKYEGMMQQFKNIADLQYEKSVKIFRQNQAAQLQQQRSNIIQENSKKLKQQAQQLQKQFQEERLKAKADYNDEIKALEHNRRVQSQQYIRKNRYFYTENLQQLRKIKQQYETKINELDSILMKQVDQRQAHLVQKNRIKIEQLRQSSRIKLKKRMEEYDKKIKLQMQSKIEKLSEEIAVTNASYQRKIAKGVQQRIKQEKQNSQLQVKQIKKSIIAIQNKIQKLKKESENIKSQRQNIEMQYLQQKNENQYLNKKLLQISKQIEDLKISQSSIEGRKHQRKQQVQNMWNRQIMSIKQSLNLVQQQIKTAIDVMREKERQMVKQTDGAIREIEKHSNKIIQQKQVQQEGLLVKIEHQQKERESLKSILQKQMEMMRNYNIK